MRNNDLHIHKVLLEKQINKEMEIMKAAFKDVVFWNGLRGSTRTFLGESYDTDIDSAIKIFTEAKARADVLVVELNEIKKNLTTKPSQPE